MWECPYCYTKLEIDFWDYHDHHNPFDCPQCSNKIYLMCQEDDGEDSVGWGILSLVKEDEKEFPY